MVSEREAWVATQVDALEGAGFKPYRANWEGAGDTVWMWDEGDVDIATVPVEIQNLIVRLDDETMSVELFVLDPEPAAFTPRVVEDIPGWKEWVDGEAR